MKSNENKRAMDFALKSAEKEKARISKGDPRNPKKYDLEKIRSDMKRMGKKTQIVPGVGMITLEPEAPVKTKAPVKPEQKEV